MSTLLFEIDGEDSHIPLSECRLVLQSAHAIRRCTTRTNPGSIQWVHGVLFTRESERQ